MKKAISFLLFISLSPYLMAQWSSSGNTVYTTNSANYVGIGVTPGNKLAVSDSANYSTSGGSSNGVFSVTNRYAGTGSNIAVFQNSNTSGSSQLAIYTPSQYITGIQAQDYGTSTAANLTINPLGGNVGIGITNPANKLEVVQTNTFTSSNPNTYAITVAQDGADLGIGSSSSGSMLQSFNSLPLFLNPVGNNVIIEGNGVSNVLIGESTQVNTAYRLDVNGGIRATGVTVNTTGADFVFDSAYRLQPLGTLGSYVKANHHLPNVASAAQMQKDGVELGAFTTKLLQKIEELTLYSVESDQKISEQQVTLARQEKALALQEALLRQMQEQLKVQQEEIDRLKISIQH